MQHLTNSKKKYVMLDKTWKELLFSFSGFGPNLLMVLMGAYFQNAVNPSALGAEAIATQSISGICLILPALFSVLWFVAKCFDGLIDIPFASITDSLRTKYGNRRIPIGICFAPMTIAFALCWFPAFGAKSENSIGNTIWIFFWALIFFASYTMCLIAFYGSFSTVCCDEKQKSRVSSFKSVFDAISYSFVYALVPIILKSANLRIDKLAYFMLPLMLTMIIPLFIIKEGTKWEAKLIAEGYDITPLNETTKVTFKQSFKLTFKNKPFLIWMGINVCSFFGLQIFLVSMNALETGALGLNATQITIANTCAFAPVPLMLYLFNKIKANNGVRFVFQMALISFGVGILGFFFGSKFFIPGDNAYLRCIFACVSGIICSFGIGAFFMMGYLIPSQISSVEEQLTKKNHSSMYFAAQAVSTSVAGAISSSLIWENIKNLFFAKGVLGVVKAYATEDLTAYQVAAQKLGQSSVDNVTNLGTFIVPLLVLFFCMMGVLIAIKMPKRYSHECVGIQIIGIQKYNAIKNKLPKTIVTPFESQSITVSNCLWVLSGTIFSWIWYYSLSNSVNTFAKKKFKRAWIFLSIILIPFGAYICYQLNKRAYEKCKQLKIKTKKHNALIIIFGILCLNCVSSSIVQYKLNKIAYKQNPLVRKAVS